MIRIAKDRCGYTGYSCKGAPDLSDAFKPKMLTCDTQLKRLTNFEIYEQVDGITTLTGSYIDNYYNLPEKIKGFVMVVDKLLDMTGISAPEESCATDMDPFGPSRKFLDAYSTFADRVVWKYTKNYESTSKTLLCAKDISTDDEYVLYPPILEPILDTEFPPATIDIPPSVDAHLDSIMIIIAFLINWRMVVEKKINDLYERLSMISSIRNLLISVAANSTTQCDCFRIRRTSGRTSGVGTVKDATYEITGCSVDLNGEQVYIEGKTGLEAPFFAYGVIKLASDSDGEMYVSKAYITTSEVSGDAFTIVFGIGGVRLVQSKDAPSGKIAGARNLWMYVVEQDNCKPNLEAVRTDKEGFLYITSGGEVPFVAYDYEECPETDDEDTVDAGI